MMADVMAIVKVWEHFRELVWSWQQSLVAAELLTPAQTQASYEAIRTYFDRELLVMATDDLSPGLAGKMRLYHTEIHRLLKLVHRDFLLWHSARQPLTKAQRRLDILAKLDMIMQFIQSMIEELKMPGSL
jgi:hypothetical protein